MKLFLVTSLLLFAASGAYVHLRGRVRHKVGRQVFDHSTFTAPMNVFMYAFSRVPTTPYPEPASFPHPPKLSANSQVLRDEGVHVMELQKTRAAHSTTQSRSQQPDWMSSRMRFISALVSGVTTRGPLTY